MHEDHGNEQYFFAPPTLDELATFVLGFERPALLCCPMLGRLLWTRHRRKVATLDIDRRFADLPGFVDWSIHRPVPLDFKPDLILSDPPFNIVGLDRVFQAFRTLAHNDFTVPVMVSYPAKKAPNIIGTFKPFDLQPTNYRPKYVTVSDLVGIVMFSNIADPARWPCSGESPVR